MDCPLSGALISPGSPEVRLADLYRSRAASRVPARHATWDAAGPIQVVVCERNDGCLASV